MTNIARKSCSKDKKMDCLINAQYLGISTNSLGEITPEAIRDWLISLQPDFLVNRSVSQAKKEESTTQEICGHKQSKLSESLGRNMSFLKTSPVCYLQNRVWMKSQADLFHTVLPFSGTWLKQGIMLSGKCWAQMKSEPRIEGNGCGYWRTPASSEPGISAERLNPIDGGMLGGMNRHFDKETGRMAQIGLTQQVQLRQFWPTPTTQDGENDGGPSQYKRNSIPLNALVKKFPTPQASMMTEADMEQAKFAGNSPNRPKYCNAGKGSLNPDWVEFLMGWPIGWSSLEPLKKLIWLGWKVDPADDGSIPRIASNIKDRVNRLKAIGNGQVSLCVATGLTILKKKRKIMRKYIAVIEAM